MGYSHKWRVGDSIDRAHWQRITGDTRLLIKAYDLTELCRGAYDQASAPRVDIEYIRFNGRGDTGCEDFLLQRQHTPRWQFCKTEYQPYERLVCAVLAIAAEHWSAISIESDGSRAAWTPHIDWASAVLRRPVPNPLPAPED